MIQVSLEALCYLWRFGYLILLFNVPITKQNVSMRMKTRGGGNRLLEAAVKQQIPSTTVALLAVRPRINGLICCLLESRQNRNESRQRNVSISQQLFLIIGLNQMTKFLYPILYTCTFLHLASSNYKILLFNYYSLVLRKPFSTIFLFTTGTR